MTLRSALANLIKKTPLLGPAEAVHGWLWRRRAKKAGTFAQHGEDVFVLNHLKKAIGTYIDVGASHPFKISNTYLLYLKGWRGVTLEPIPRLSRLHRKWRPDDIHLSSAAGDKPGTLTFLELIPSVLSTFDVSEGERMVRENRAQLRGRHQIQIVTLADVWQKHLGAKPIDLLSIDTEGFEMAVLRGLDWSKIKPRLIICETARPGEESRGNEVAEFLKGQGYQRIKTLGCNDVYEFGGAS